jgi:CheY-like chemotaxis protein
MRVLFVDDEPLNRTVVTSMLETSGVETAEASDAVSGLRMIQAEKFDVVLMDLRMPGMDGLFAIQYLRTRADERSGVPVVLVTADTSADLPERAKAAGADRLVLKPVDMGRLFDAIAGAMSERGAAVLS